MKLCRICLSDKGRLYAMKKQLKTLYQHLTGLDKADKRLPQWVCAECGLRLMSYDKLREKSLRSHKLLCQILDKSKNVTKKTMLEINSLRLESSLSFSNLNLAVYNPDVDNLEETSWTINYSESDFIVPKEEKEDPFGNLELITYSITNNDSGELKSDMDTIKVDAEPEYCEIEFLDEEKIEDLPTPDIKIDQDSLPSDTSCTKTPLSKKAHLKKKVPLKKSKKVLKTKKVGKKKVPLKKVSLKKTTKKEAKTSAAKQPVQKEDDFKENLTSELPLEVQIVEIDMGKEYNLELKNNTGDTEGTEPEYCEIEFLDDEQDENEFDTIIFEDALSVPTPTKKVIKKRTRDKNTKKVSLKKAPETKQPAIPKEDEMNKYFTIVELSMEEQIREIEKRKAMAEYASANYKCEFCFKWFTGKEAYDDHMLRHSLVSGRSECRVCRSRFKSEYYLKCHLRRTHGKLFKCNSCDFVSTVRGSAVRHGNLHSGAMYLCPHCVMQFNDNTTFWRHMRMRHNSSDHVCAECGHEFISVNGLRVHRFKKHSGLDFEVPMTGPRCEKCNITFASEEAYNTHVRISNRHQDDSTKVKRKRKEYQSIMKPKPCEECGLQVDNINAFINHFRRAHPDKKRTQYLSSKSEPAMCELCGRLLKHSVALKAHMAVVHGTERTRLYECEECARTFSQPLYLSKHLQEAHDKHVKVPLLTKPWQCQKCGKVMSNKQSLRTHLKTHDVNRPKPHCCKQCGKGFYTKCRLQRHMTIHQEARFKCNECKKRFFSNPDLYQHMVNEHCKL